MRLFCDLRRFEPSDVYLHMNAIKAVKIDNTGLVKEYEVNDYGYYFSTDNAEY